jgi:phytoene/squalene synthetase
MTELDPVSEAARRLEPDWYLSALYAPEPARGLMIGIAAFAGELMRVADATHEPAIAEIRLQWWRDAVGGYHPGSATGHPVADRLGLAIAEGRIPIGLCLGIIDAASAKAARTTLADRRSLDTELTKSYGAIFGLATRALGMRHAEALERATAMAGLAYGLSRLLAGSTRPGDWEWQRLPGDLSADGPDARMALGQEALNLAKTAARSSLELGPENQPAFLPLAMVPVYISAARRGKRVGPMQRWWHLWRANWVGRMP